MTDLVKKIRDEVIRRSNDFEKITKGTRDEYNLYQDHIQYVYKYAKELAKIENVDLEVLELCALLHDISMTDIKLDRSKHNVYSSLMAEELLSKYNYPKEKIKLIKKCILNHSSKRKKYRTTLEEQILVNADSLSHFDNIESIYSLAFNVMGLKEEDAILFVKDKLTKDFEEISDDIKPLIIDKYYKVLNSKSKKDLLIIN